MALRTVSINITCPKCRSIGVAVWELGGSEPSLISVSRNFYERISMKARFNIELVCDVCGTVQPEGPTA